MSKQPASVQSDLLYADEQLEIAADKHNHEDRDTKTRLRDAALAFAEAWHACGAAKGRP